MTQELAAITSYFNPFNSPWRYPVYQAFKKHLREHHSCEPFTIELGFHDNFETPPGDRTFHVKGSLKENILWQKERLLNILLQHIPDQYQYIAWLDNDIIFTNKNLIPDTITQLRRHWVVQMFGTGNRLKRDGKVERSKAGFVKHLHMNGPAAFKNAPRYSFTGFAWASRRELLEKYGLFEYSINGSADVFMALAFMNRFPWDHIDHMHLWKNNVPFRKKFDPWAKGVVQTVSGNVGYVAGDVFHLYHGELRKRRYILREVAVNELNYDPENDLQLDANGVLQWRKDSNPALQKFFESFWKGVEGGR